MIDFEMSLYLLVHPKVSKSSNLEISFETEREEDREMENPEQIWQTTKDIEPP
jgi:hypothetical protein